VSHGTIHGNDALITSPSDFHSLERLRRQFTILEIALSA
jgi:hypothetical protein